MPPITTHRESRAWYGQPAQEVLKELATTADGLGSEEAARRLLANGANELKEGRRESSIRIFLGHFKSLIIWMLLAAGVVSALLGGRLDAVVILAIVVLNNAIGFYQELKAEKSIAALKSLTAPQARVGRDGRVISIPAAGIVTGDLLVLAAGDQVAADARLLETASLIRAVHDLGQSRRRRCARGSPGRGHGRTGTRRRMTVRALYVAENRYEVTGEGYGPDGEVRFGSGRKRSPVIRGMPASPSS